MAVGGGAPTGHALYEVLQWVGEKMVPLSQWVARQEGGVLGLEQALMILVATGSALEHLHHNYTFHMYVTTGFA